MKRFNDTEQLCKSYMSAYNLSYLGQIHKYLSINDVTEICLKKKSPLAMKAKYKIDVNFKCDVIEDFGYVVNDPEQKAASDAWKNFTDYVSCEPEADDCEIEIEEVSK